MCFVAEGLAHYWSEEAAWHTDHLPGGEERPRGRWG
jgi:hypothetical protein